MESSSDRIKKNKKSESSASFLGCYYFGHRFESRASKERVVFLISSSKKNLLFFPTTALVAVLLYFLGFVDTEGAGKVLLLITRVAFFYMAFGTLLPVCGFFHILLWTKPKVIFDKLDGNLKFFRGLRMVKVVAKRDMKAIGVRMVREDDRKIPGLVHDVHISSILLKNGEAIGLVGATDKGEIDWILKQLSDHFPDVEIQK